MKPLDRFFEFSLINRLTKNLVRHPRQVNACHQADAEIIRQDDGTFFAVSTDTLQEEYNFGLIRDPFIVGWSVVAHSLSDLAAVCADPLGVVLALNFPKNISDEWGQKFYDGVQAALEAHSTYCLGGDTNFSQEPSFTCTAMGFIRKEFPITRMGADKDDVFYVTGPLGGGNLLGITSQVDHAAWKVFEQNYRPVARLKEAEALSPFIKCMIDTSDALLQAMAIISELNGIGICFEHREDLYESSLIPLTKKINFPLWLVNVFGMGEYELFMAISRNREASFLEEAKRQNIPVKKVGQAMETPGISLAIEDKNYSLDVPYLLNLFGQSSSIQEYLKELVIYDQRLRGIP